MYFFSEESNILTMRARLVVLAMVSALVIGLTFMGIDENYYQHFLTWLNTNNPIPESYYYFAVGLLGVLVVGLYVQNSTWSSQLIIVTLCLILARFVHYYLPDWVFAAVLYTLGSYYLIIVLNNIFIKPLERIAATLSGLFIMGVLVFFVNALGYKGYYGTCISIIFVGGIWLRLFWILEYKRRQKCAACSGWGKKTARFKDIFWWALGYKERTQMYDPSLELKQTIMQLLGYKNYQALPTTCPECKGKGWKYRQTHADDILYAPDDGYGENKNLKPQNS